MTEIEQKDLEGKSQKLKEDTEEKTYIILSGKAFRIKVVEEKVEEIRAMTDRRKKLATIIKKMRCYVDDEPSEKDFESDKRALIAWFGG